MKRKQSKSKSKSKTSKRARKHNNQGPKSVKPKFKPAPTNLPSDTEERKQIEIETWLEEKYEVTVRYVQSRGISDPKAVVHDAFLEAQLKWDVNKARFSTWIRRVLGFDVIDSLRKRKGNERTVPIDSVDPAALLITSEEEQVDRARCFEEACCVVIRRLAPDKVALLEARYSQGLAIDALSVLFGVSEGVLKMRLKRAREALRELFKEAGCYSLADAEDLGDNLLHGGSPSPKCCCGAAGNTPCQCRGSGALPSEPQPE